MLWWTLNHHHFLCTLKKLTQRESVCVLETEALFLSFFFFCFNHQFSFLMNKNKDNSTTTTNNVPDWSLQLTEQLLSPSPIIVHEERNNKDEQFQEYIDRHFTDNKAKILKNRISEATTLGKNDDSTKKNNNNKIPASEEEDEERAWWVVKEDDREGFYSIGGLLFLFGFICPPLWWIGSFWPRQVKEKGGKMADRWQKINRIMSLGFSIILIILIIVFAVLYATQRK